MDEPIVRLAIPSVITALPDGRWHGTYPSTEIEVVRDHKEDVGPALAQELSKLEATDEFQERLAAARAGTAVPDGWIREEIDRAEYERRMMAAFEQGAQTRIDPGSPAT